jgi:AraC family transcriptional regulator of arabinose operon
VTPSRRLTSPPTCWRCEPGWSWHARPLTDHLLWYVMDGAGYLTLGGRTWDLAPGTAVVFGPGDQPAAGQDPRRRLLVFGMHFTGADGPGPPESRPAVPRTVRDQGFLATLAARADAAYRRGDPLGDRQAVLCLEQILCLLREEMLLPAPSAADLAVDRIADRVRQDPGQPWSVPALACQASLSPAQFTRRFRARTGLAPGSFIIAARIQRARQLLAETSLTIGQVSAALGYADPAFFSRQYRQYTGQPPSALRLPGQPSRDSPRR